MRLQELPLEYNTWLLFRQAVDIILLKSVVYYRQFDSWLMFCSDFVSYCLFAFTCFRIPEDLSVATHVMRYVQAAQAAIFFDTCTGGLAGLR